MATTGTQGCSVRLGLGSYAEVLVSEAKAIYEAKKAAADVEYAQSSSRAGKFTMAAVFVVVAVVASLAGAMRSNNGALLGVGVLALVVCGVLLLRERARGNAAARVSSLYERALLRVSGAKVQSGHTGEEFVRDEHLYARDLDIVGPNSMFGMLATTRSALGRRELAAWLLDPPTREQVLARQDAVRELVCEYDLRERVALLGRSDFEELSADSFEHWLEMENTVLPNALRALITGLTAAWIAVLVAGLVMRLPLDQLARNVLAVLALQGALCLRFRVTVRAELEQAEKLVLQTSVLRAGLQIMHGHAAFASPLLRGLQQSARGEASLKELERWWVLVEQRAKEWYYLPALLFGVGTHAAVALQRWRRRHAAGLRESMAAWGAFDAALAVSGYAAEHTENVYPVVEETREAAVFAAEAMVHPLLPQASAVANDVMLGDEAQFLLISGSNMAGKSTLLRAMGANVVLAFTGAPVCVRSLRCNTLHVGASLALSDSLADGRSKFLAEVQRLSGIVALAEEHRGAALFLIDEIFSGTNSADRKAAAEAVVKSLVAAGAVGAVSTHDLALAEIAAFRGRNVHMASRSEDDPLDFDYTLKDGVNRTTNALAIVRMLGLG